MPEPPSPAVTPRGTAPGIAAPEQRPRLWVRSTPYALLALLAGGATLIWALLTGRMLLYGDATAHLAIARRMVDSATPGLSQWGTVWLPLPHLLMAVFVLIPGWWKSGLAGAIPSLLALVLATVLLHRTVRRVWGPNAAAWAAVVFCLNPSLLYLSAVPMTESIYLAAFLGLVERCSAYLEHPSRARLFGAAAFGLAGSLCRYDGWFVLPFALVVLVWPHRRNLAQAWGVAWRFTLITNIGPAFWFLDNWYYFKDPLAFARGPYSARQIYLNALRHGGFRYPGDHNWGLAALYYLKTVTLTCGVPLMILALLGWILFALRWARHQGGESRSRLTAHCSLVLLLLPLPWYLWAMYSGNVPIFLPQYWPHGYYNLRYGVQLLPAVAAGSGILVALMVAAARRLIWRRVPKSLVIGLALIAAGAYLSMLQGEGPVAYAEAVHNAPDRLAMEHKIAAALRPRRPGQRVLMYYGTFPGAIADDDIPVRDVVQESNFHLWDAALAQPQNYVDWVVVEQNTPAASGINRADLRKYFQLVGVLLVPTQHTVTVYRRDQPLPHN